MNTAQARNVIEAALLSAANPLSMSDLRRLFDDELDADTVRSMLESLQADWSERGVRLVALAGGWRFQTAPEVAPFLARLHPEKPPRYSRAVMETLAIVAYRQPVTRGDIEEIRGVAVSSPVVKTLEERGWIEVIGHKEVIGRPELLATTRQFLDDLGLRSLDELPALPDPGAVGEVAAVVQALEQQLDGQAQAAPVVPEAAEAGAAAEAEDAGEMQPSLELVLPDAVSPAAVPPAAVPPAAVLPDAVLPGAVPPAAAESVPDAAPVLEAGPEPEIASGPESAPVAGLPPAGAEPSLPRPANVSTQTPDHGSAATGQPAPEGNSP